ncbi:Orn/Lys/Arg decarboxylase N-terminal domain-containing protein [Victivallis sp. Marseille-Q1083]|uniref:Orn/Lys/Arg family decarboxylase n=1 Tax=Victivallis sp. Marseille-Q1083 TaxID=2717288 RepID=UPI00158DD6A8|nr:Orn/Lys/Arg decarboxylase N-terminal domain-containing protein [Victivallis sp. Marseille-Q1083]
MKTEKSQWPILLVSKQLGADNDDAFRLRELIAELENVQDCTVIVSCSYEDALEISVSRADLGTIIIDWDLPLENQLEAMTPDAFVAAIRQRNRTIPLILLTDRLETENLPTDALAEITDCLWKTADPVPFRAGRFVDALGRYLQSFYPPFFGELVKYAEQYKYAWHTPGHLGGQGFLRSPAGVAMYKYFGENVFRSDLSISVPELGSLLDHEGVVCDAERNSARAFGADQTYYVLNGTSTVNQIVWRSQLVRDDIAFVDRNCHKSLNYAMVITEALPVYMIPRRNKRGIIGPVRLSEFTPASIRQKIDASTLIPAELKKNPVKMSALTNSTYDGVCYNVVNIKKQLEKSVENLHFDEAWYAYACFSPMYKNHYGMAEDELQADHPPIFCSQSTHKLLTAFSQASMLHIKNGGSIRINPDEFNESYMMHGSTSPQYSMIASLDVATKMMQDNGGVMMRDIILEAVQLRKKTASLNREFAARGDWFFDMWQPRKVKADGRTVDFCDAETDYLADHQEPWVMRRDNNWHGFDDIEDDYVMLDPIKLTFTTPGLDDDGRMGNRGIPAGIVTNYLIDRNIVCEKTDYYSFLMLNSLGTTRAKQGSLLAALLQFKRDFDGNTPLADIFPALVDAHGERYAGVGLKDHCLNMHRYIKEHDMLGKMQAAFQIIPDQALKPADAYHEVVRRNVEYVFLDAMMNRIPAVMMVPYPPGIPIMMGGEKMNEKARPIFEYLKAREDFENEFPGYEGDIHGVEREVRDGRTCFKTMCIKSK